MVGHAGLLYAIRREDELEVWTFSRSPGQEALVVEGEVFLEDELALEAVIQ